jgi:hypothetical protein
LPTFIVGIMEHIEEAGIHSLRGGSSAFVDDGSSRLTPPARSGKSAFSGSPLDTSPVDTIPGVTAAAKFGWYLDQCPMEWYINS